MKSVAIKAAEFSDLHSLTCTKPVLLMLEKVSVLEIVSAGKS